MSSLKFGTSGLRGLVTDMRPDVCTRYVHAFLRHIETDSAAMPARRILVGRDLRPSSPAIAAACLSAAAAAGYEALDCGALPTPALALEAMRIAAPAIMVTGSHIPADRNGLKFYQADGEIAKADEAGILAQFDRCRDDGLAASAAKAVPASRLALENYRRRYVALADAFSLHGMRVGVYQHSSVARDLIVQVLADMGVHPVPLGRSDIFVPVDTEALRPEDVELARRWAGEERLDAIVSTDGDADRPLIADERGDFLRGDDVGILTASFLDVQTVVTPVTSSTAVEGAGRFGRVIRTRVGSPYVIEAMAAQVGRGGGAVVGFEANGGVMLGGDARCGGHVLAALPTRDALLPILSVLALARRERKAVSQLVATLPARFTASGRLENVPMQACACLFAALSGGPQIKAFLEGVDRLVQVDRTDGVRLALATGDTLHFRASGNAPELRCYAEAATPAQARRLLDWGLAKAGALAAKAQAG